MYTICSLWIIIQGINTVFVCGPSRRQHIGALYRESIIYLYNVGNDSVLCTYRSDLWCIGTLGKFTLLAGAYVVGNVRNYFFSRRP